VWGVEARLTWKDKPDKGTWNLIFTSAIGNDNAIAYHDFDVKTAPLPFAFVDVGLAVDHSGNVTQAASHELGEMLVNPGTNYWAGVGTLGQNNEGVGSRLLALEIADPVQEVSFSIDGNEVSDFVYPAYFEPWRDGPTDACGVLGYQSLSPGGYQIVRDVSDDRIYDVFGAKAPALRCARHTQIMRAK
jgi:hypothetical protein